MSNNSTNMWRFLDVLVVVVILSVVSASSISAQPPAFEGYDFTPTAIETTSLGGNLYEVTVHMECRDAHEETTPDTVLAGVRLLINDAAVFPDAMIHVGGLDPIPVPQCHGESPCAELDCVDPCPDKVVIYEFFPEEVVPGFCMVVPIPGPENQCLCFCSYLMALTFSPVTIPPGATVMVVVDPDNEVEEFDENNNIIYLGGPIPTLTEWGMIIFCLLLFGWMAWVIVRRGRRVTARI